MGFGILYYPNGSRYEGNWKDGKKHGKGAYIYPGGQMYTCVYADGTKKAQGKFSDAAIDVEEVQDNYRSLAAKS